MKTITLKKLKELEAQEYKELSEISHLAYEYEAEGRPASKIRDLETYQRGRWGMLSDLIEELEND